MYLSIEIVFHFKQFLCFYSFKLFFGLLPLLFFISFFLFLAFILFASFTFLFSFEVKQHFDLELFVRSRIVRVLAKLQIYQLMTSHNDHATWKYHMNHIYILQYEKYPSTFSYIVVNSELRI